MACGILSILMSKFEKKNPFLNTINEITTLFISIFITTKGNKITTNAF